MRLRLLSFLLFLSGFCALVYQMVWLREFRLIFGAATPATAAVLAVFMGGLGLGSAWLGRRAERTEGLLRLYGWIELAITGTAFITPLLLRGVRALYIQTGGVEALGSASATGLHLVLAVIVLLVPCTLMGGTLPVAVKYVESDDDPRRGSAGLLYGLNALGAVAGVGASTFWLLEKLGTRGTLWAAAGLNLALAGVALWGATREKSGASIPGPKPKPVRARAEPALVPAAAPAAFVYGAAFTTGFVFFLVELVWYRMLAPLLGSSTYNFGLILALALAGIGLGGLAYRIWLAPRAGQASPGAFSMVLALQAFWLVLPFALGDRVAVFAFHASQLRSVGFGGQIAAWTAVAAVLVLLPSIFAGLQFPLLVGLLGRGRTDVGRQLGFAYAANTGGAIAGSLLGGFLLIPGLTAPGCWKLTVWLTVLLAALALAFDFRRGWRRTTGAVAALMTASLWMSLAAEGPTAFWRHSPIGYGRFEGLPETPAERQDFFNDRRRRTHQEFEGRESSVGLIAADSYAFYVNGKSDGSALGDAPTQVMSGLIGAALHPHPRLACVVGLGTGSTAGWLADVPGMERVDVFEIEPGMCDLARDAFAPVNRDVMRKSNVRVILGDAREALLVKGAPYDLIASEPSNPYRAGIASLFTREFYEAVQGRLNPEGIFCQWVQGYEVDAATIQLVYATLGSVFPFIETWVTKYDDLLFVCHQQPPAYSLDQLRRRVATAPFKEAMSRVWQADSVEGFLARHYAGPELARAAAARESRVNTDDRNLLEYGFARALHRSGDFESSDLLQVAMRDQIDCPAHLRGQIDPARLLEERLLSSVADGVVFEIPARLQGDARRRAEAMLASIRGDYPAVLQLWAGEPRSLMAKLMLVEAAGQAGQPESSRAMLAWIEQDWPVEARLAAARLAARHGAPDAAAEHLRIALSAMRDTPWLRARTTKEGLSLARALGQENPSVAAAFFALLEQPFPVAAYDSDRIESRMILSRQLGPRDQVAAIDALGRHPPWNRVFLEYRCAAFDAANDPRAGLARRELDRFRAQTRAP
jgi:spermidine synthase